MAKDVVAVAADHRGFGLKEDLKGRLELLGYEVLDLGTEGRESVDYPDYGHRMGHVIETGEACCGVLVCGTGIGISIAANRHPGVRAAVCHDVSTTRLSRRHNNANVLALGADVVGAEVAMDCLKAFLETEFEGGRHEPRVEKLG
ncbi:MAG: ribose 5-phosphate isomerase B [Alphaproteobacteria bacterium]